MKKYIASFVVAAACLAFAAPADAAPVETRVSAGVVTDAASDFVDGLSGTVANCLSTGKSVEEKVVVVNGTPMNVKTTKSGCSSTVVMEPVSADGKRLGLTAALAAASRLLGSSIGNLPGTISQLTDSALRAAGIK